MLRIPHIITRSLLVSVLFPYFTSLETVVAIEVVVAKASSATQTNRRRVKKDKKSSSTKKTAAKKCTAKDLPKFSNLFVFGDSLSDQGNLASVFPAYPARSASNGNFAVEYIAEELGLELQISNHLIALQLNKPEFITGTNYAVSAATLNPDSDNNVPTQVQAFLFANQGTAPSDALYYILAGANDVFQLFDEKYFYGTEKTDDELFQHLKNVAIESLSTNVLKPLLDAGAKHIIVSQIPDTGLVPVYSMQNQPKARSDFARKSGEYFNQYMKAAIEKIECERNDTNIVLFDKMNQAIAIAVQKKGLQVSSPCTIGATGVPYVDPIILPYNGAMPPSIWDPACVLPDADGFAFWDEFHPTDAVHKIVADLTFDQMCPEMTLATGGSYAKHSKKKVSKKCKETKSKKAKSSK